MVSQIRPRPVLVAAHAMRHRCYIFATCSVKISVMLFYRRLSSGFSRGFFIATWIGIAYNVAYLVTFVTLIGVACRPISAYWMQVDLVEGWALTHKFTCIDEHTALPLSGALSLVGDLYATLLPCILIFRLDLPRRQKLTLYPLFLLGFLVVAAGIVRTYSLDYLINHTYDNTWYLWKCWIWSMVELYVSIVAASAPALNSFFRRFLLEPISLRKGASYSYARGQGAESRRERGAQRGLWSKTSIMMHLGGNGEAEKMGPAVCGDGIPKYELRTLPNGKVEPVLMNVGLEKSFDVQSDSVASTFYSHEHSGWTLPVTRLADDRGPLRPYRPYRAGIETLPPIPGPGRPAPVVGFVGADRSGTPRHSLRDESESRHSPPVPRSSVPSSARGGAERDRSDDLARRLSQGSVKAGRLRAESLTQAAAAAAWRAAKRASRDPDDSDDAEYGPPNASTSDETLQLPKQRNGDRDSSVYDDNSLHLPRQGADRELFRQSRIGCAV
jgi:hypothetical protein